MDRLETIQMALQYLNQITETSMATIEMLHTNAETIRFISEELLEGATEREVEWPEWTAPENETTHSFGIDSTTLVHGETLEELSDKMVEAIQSKENDNPFGLHAIQLDIPEGIDYEELTKMVNQKLTGTYQPLKRKGVQNGDDDLFDFTNCIKK